MNVSDLITQFYPLVENGEIQSEAEVRSKFIVPLLEILGYSMQHRAEEFPVYGSEGSKTLPVKKADFLQFTDSDFAAHRSKSTEDQTWVFEHSLLVFEAKKPSEKILVVDQPQFYAAWTRSIAYIISNGRRIEGYIVNPNYSDQVIISCDISEIPVQFNKLSLLNYQNILAKKKEAALNNQELSKDLFFDYVKAMELRCARELYHNVTRILHENPAYTPQVKSDAKSYKIEDLVEEVAIVITSEPGGGKSSLMWQLMRNSLRKYSEDARILPVILEGKYYGCDYHSVTDGIIKELQYHCHGITSEFVETMLKNGQIQLLFDGLDEIRNSANYSKDIISHELSQLVLASKGLRVIVSSREQNYHGELSTFFKHLQIEKLSNEKISELIALLSDNNIQINIWSLPNDLQELIRTPLFLKMFIDVLKENGSSNIPKSKLALFSQYLTKRLELLNCNLFQTVKIKSILADYAHYVIENRESTEEYIKILEHAVANEAEKYNNLIWNTGLVIEGRDGIKFFHKSISEYFYAIHLSYLDNSDIETWLKNHILEHSYDEIICYLTGVVSQQQTQDLIMDYIECNNLPLLIRSLKTRKTFEPSINSVTESFGRQYFTQLLNSYRTIVSCHFNKVAHIFDGYRDKDNQCCLTATIDSNLSSISLLLYEGSHDTPPVKLKMESNVGMIIKTAQGTELSYNSAVFTNGHLHQRFFNLQQMGYGFDSARETAIYIIKNQLLDALDKKHFLDIFFPVLLCETIEIELEKMKTKIPEIPKEMRKKVSLYSMSLQDLASLLFRATKVSHDHRFKILGDLCCLLEEKKVDPKEWLDVPPDIEPGPNRFGLFDDLYTDKQVLEKITRIITLCDNATYEIITDYLPFLSQFDTPAVRTLGFIYRDKSSNGQGYFRSSSFDYISLRCTESETSDPIILITDKQREIIGHELPEKISNLISSIGKTKNDIVNRGSAVLSHYFEKNIFHKTIYDDIKQRVEAVFHA